MHGDNTGTDSPQNTIDAIKKQQDEMAKQLDKLVFCVIGNQEYGTKGLVKDVADLKQFRDTHIAIRNKFMGGMAVFSVIWVAVLEYIKTKIFN